MKEQLLEAVFPNRCFVCMDFTKEKSGICHECLSKIEYININTSTCFKCGMPKNLCQCKYRYYHFKGIVAPFKNDGAMQRGIYNLKFNGLKSAGDFYGKSMAKLIEIKFKNINFDYICPVPMKKLKKITRGYNQASVLAKSTAKYLNNSHIIFLEDLLIKTKRTKTQHKITFEERWKNLRNAYKLNSKYNIKNKNILLIDDIKTTGATLDECSRILMLGGANAVYCTTALIGF